MLVDLINMALNSDIIHLEQKARKRIKDNFSVNKRKKMLLSVLTN